MSAEPTNRPYLTMAEIVARCGISKSTLKRRKAEGAFPNAIQNNPSDPRSPWQIPLTDLLAAGLNPGAAKSAAAPEADLLAVREATVTLSMADYNALREQQTKAEVLAAKLSMQEQLLVERQAVVDGLRNEVGLYQRQLEAAPATKATETTAPVVDLTEPTVDLTGLSWSERRRRRKAQKRV